MFVFFVLIWFHKASNSVTYLVITVNTICFCGEDLSFLLLFLVFCKRCMLIFVRSVYLNWVCWVRGNFLASRVMYISRVCVSAVWSGGPVQFYLAFSVGADGGTVRIFLSFWLCSGGYGTVEMVKGVVRVFLCFLQFADSSLGG